MAATNLAPSVPARGKGGFARFWRVLRQLFHEVVGGIFGVLALAWLQGGIRAWTQDVAHWLVFAALGVAVVLGLFSWDSFRRAYQLGREAPPAGQEER